MKKKPRYPDGPLGLTYQEVEVVTAIAKRGEAFIRRDDLLDEVWGVMVVDPKIVDVLIFKARRKLEVAGYAIDNRFGRGWRIAPASLDGVRAALGIGPPAHAPGPSL